MDKVEIKKFAVMAREMSKAESSDIPNFEEYIIHLADKRDFEFFLKEKDKIINYIKGLKSQLKASEEKCHEQWLEIQAETHQIQMLKQDKERIKKNWQISRTHQQKLYNNLKQQNKAKGIVNYPIILDGCRIANEEQLLDFAKDFCQEKKYWQEQLAEKEKEHELLIDQFEEETEKLRKQIKQESDARKRFVEANKQLKQSQNQTAIAKLQKVLEWLNIPFDENGCLKNGEDLENYIDQQITELKGEDV